MILFSENGTLQDGPSENFLAFRINQVILELINSSS